MPPASRHRSRRSSPPAPRHGWRSPRSSLTWRRVPTSLRALRRRSAAGRLPPTWSPSPNRQPGCGRTDQRRLASWTAARVSEWSDGSTHEISAPAGALCSSYRAEMVALRETLGYLRDHPAHSDTESLIVVCTDSQAALSALGGPAEQRSSLNRDVWDALISLAGAEHRRIRPLRPPWKREGRRPR